MNARQRQQYIARDRAQGQSIQSAPPPGDKSMTPVRYVEGWIRCDTDGDHRSELIHVHLLGNATTLVKWERTDETPLACFTAYREPGRVIGQSQADMVMDLQRTESRVMRGVLDSLGQSMFPRTMMVQGQANLADVRQTAIGAIIRVSQPNAVSELVKPFMGKEALPVMDVLEKIRESRTGITRASSGLTVDELQSTTPMAVSQQASAAQDRLDMVARTLAETGLAPLYTGILKMLARQQDRPNVIRIRNPANGVAIDLARALATMWQCQVNVGGKGMPSERLAMLQAIAQKARADHAGRWHGPTRSSVSPNIATRSAECSKPVNIGDVSSYFKAPICPEGFQPPQPRAAATPTPTCSWPRLQKQKTAAEVEETTQSRSADQAGVPAARG